MNKIIQKFEKKVELWLMTKFVNKIFISGPVLEVADS